MNTQALHQLYGQAMSMLDSALSTLSEMRALEQRMSKSETEMTEEEKKRRRRLKALRWSFLLGVSYMGYRFVLKWVRRRRQLKEFYKMQMHNDQSGMGSSRSALANSQSYDIHSNHQNYPNGYRHHGQPSYSNYDGSSLGMGYSGRTMNQGYSNFNNGYINGGFLNHGASNGMYDTASGGYNGGYNGGYYGGGDNNMYYGGSY